MWFNKKDDKHYKIISFKTYAWDQTINNTRRYRTVFDKNEINYLSVALEFYNKYFDEKDWKLTLTFKAFSTENEKKTKEHCSETKNYTISKDINSVICDYGWGNDKHGTYWEKGEYLWEVYNEDELIDTTHFRIENYGLVKSDNNPYFQVKCIKTYQSKTLDDLEENRTYLRQFLHLDTHYVMTELTIINSISERWLCELFFNYYDDSGLLLGTANEINFISPQWDDESNIIVAGIGNSKTSMWLKDNYRVEVVFMGSVVATSHFSIGDKLLVLAEDYEAITDSLEEKSKILKEETTKINTKNSSEEKEIKGETKAKKRPLNEIFLELENLIGLKNIKTKIKDYVDYIEFLQLRKEKGIKESGEINLHSVFTGNPGTGKTTVAKLLGQLYHEIGLLSIGHVITVGSSDLISGYVRQTGETTKAVIKTARGGILFIDEAYMLFREGALNDNGPEAIEALLNEMSDGEGDIAIIVAGYPNEMEKFINSNPGIKSRFANYFNFKDYTPSELVQIAKYAAKKKGMSLSKKANLKLKKIIVDAYRKKDKSFGNARFSNALVDEAKMNLGIRLIRNNKQHELTKKLLSTIQDIDIEDLSEQRFESKLKLEVDTSSLNEAVTQLSKLTGLKEIKKEIQELIQLTKYYKEINRDILKAFSLHAVFLGNPGTGKTTVARLIGKIYKALGLLERGHLIEVDGSDLIAGYIGQTSIKTKELIKSAMGGILFIDEAYSITEGTSGNNSASFGKKAIATLIKEMEDHRGEFCVIVAGYTDNMKFFLQSNPGMKSRFDKTFHFIDFTENELWTITENMFSERGLQVEDKAAKYLKNYISNLYLNRDKFFGNARSMRKVVEKTVRDQELRMSKLSKNERTLNKLEFIIYDDVIGINSIKIKNTTRKIGYK